jgi:hypothetical protein
LVYGLPQFLAHRSFSPRTISSSGNQPVSPSSAAILFLNNQIARRRSKPYKADRSDRFEDVLGYGHSYALRHLLSGMAYVQNAATMTCNEGMW